MKPLSVFLALSLLAFSAFAKDDVPYEYTQTGMNEAAGKHLKAAEAEMKKVFGELVKNAGGKTEAIMKLKAAQTAWEAYRDAQLDALWPSLDDRRYGSAHPMCLADMKRRITEARIGELKAMLKPEEGDVCFSKWPE